MQAIAQATRSIEQLVDPGPASNAGTVSQQLQAAIAQATALIEQLVDPRFASNAGAISQQLQDLQSGGQGWSLAEALLSSDDANLQFYGALGFQIKLNRDGHLLDPDDASSILTCLMSRFIYCATNSRFGRAFDKLCACLVTYFLQSPLQWDHALDDAVFSLLQNRPSTGHVVHDDFHTAGRLLTVLSVSQVWALLRLAKILAEDLTMVDSSLDTDSIESAFETCVPTFSHLLRFILADVNNLTPQFVKEALDAYITWAYYAVLHLKHHSETWKKLQATSDSVIQILAVGNVETVCLAAEKLAIVIDESVLFMSKAQLLDVWPVLNRAQAITEELSLDDRLPLMRLLVACGKAKVHDIVADPTEPTHQEFLSQITRSLFDIDWAEDTCEHPQAVLEFWDEFVNAHINTAEDVAHDDGETRELFRSIVDPAIQALFDALDPKDEKFRVHEADLEDWEDARRTFCELLATLTEASIIPTFTMLADQLEGAIEQGNWNRVELVLQLMPGMAREYDSSSISEQALGRIFESHVYRSIFDLDAENTMTIRPKTSLIRLVDSYSFFLLQQPARIPAMLTFVMNTLETHATTDADLAESASKCFRSICVACRSKLVDQIDEVIEFCGHALKFRGLTAYQREKLYGSIASVIVGLPSESAQIGPLTILVGQLHADLESAKLQLDRNQSEKGAEGIVTALSCLGAIGRAVKNRPRRIEVDVVKSGAEGDGLRQSAWSSQEGQALSQLVFSCLSFTDLIPQNGNALETVCRIFRTGLDEQEPSPFVFSSTLISSFLRGTITVSHRHLDSLLNTSCVFVSAMSRKTHPRVVADIQPLHATIVNVILALDGPSSDPGGAALATDFFESLLPRYPDVLLGCGPDLLSGLVRFELAAFTADSAWLKRSVTSFLAALVALPRQLDKGEIQTPDDAPGLPPFARSFVAELLPPLAAAVAHQIGGHAQRSELEAVAKVLRGVVVASAGARGLLEQALDGPSFPGEAKVGAAEKRMFVSRVVLLRGGRGTAEAVKEFWAKCRGTVSTYS